MRRAKGAASRFARPKWASASVNAVGMRIVEAAKTIGPATNPPPPRTTSGRRRAQDPPARARRAGREQHRAQLRERRTAWQAGDPEGVELVARFRNQTRFDAIRRPGERHVHAAPSERVRDRERRQHVSCRSPGCDQAPQRLLFLHDERC